MSLRNYLDKLRAKPVRERERIAIIVTVAGFFVFVAIWVVSLKEMNKQSEQPADETSASLNDLKTNFETGKDSIQNMMQQLPNQTGATGVGNSAGSAAPNSDGNLQNPGDSTSPENSLDEGANNSIENNNNQNKDSVPQLP